MVVLLLVLRRVLPRDLSHTKGMGYARLLGSLWDLFRSEPTVRGASIFGGLAFGAFSVFWVTLAFFLATPPYHYGSGVAGMFGLAGIARALAASVSGCVGRPHGSPAHHVGVPALCAGFVCRV